MEYKILGIDFGTKLIGIAISDPSNSYAIPYSVESNNGNFFNELQDIVDIENIKIIVVGFPKTINNYISERHQLILDFIKELKLKIKNVTIEIVDESYTTISAINTQKKYNMNKSTIKKTKDMLSASFILDIYLSKIKNNLL